MLQISVVLYSCGAKGREDEQLSWRGFAILPHRLVKERKGRDLLTKAARVGGLWLLSCPEKEMRTKREEM